MQTNRNAEKERNKTTCWNFFPDELDEEKSVQRTGKRQWCRGAIRATAQGTQRIRLKFSKNNRIWAEKMVSSDPKLHARIFGGYRPGTFQGSELKSNINYNFAQEKEQHWIE